MVITTGPGTLYISDGTGAWQAWNQNQVYTTSSTTNAWQSWNQQWTSVGTTGATWGSWNLTYTPVYTAPVPAETEEIQAERRRRAEQDLAVFRAQQEEAQRVAKAASAHAEELLLALLSDEQADTWREHDWFTVRGSRTGRTYRIKRGTLSNVARLDESGEAEMFYCAHPPDVPTEDANLAQMLLLVTDEDRFLYIANSHQVPRRLRPVEAALEARVDAVMVHERPQLHAVA